MSQTATLLVTFAVILVVVIIRVRRMTREQRFGIYTMWIVPLIFAGLTGFIMTVDHVTAPLQLGLSLVALAAGAGLGIYQGTHTTVRVDRAARAMFVKVSPVGIAIFIGVLLLRIAIRTIYGGAMPPTASANPVSGGALNLISVALLVFVVGMVVGLRIYLARAWAMASEANRTH